MNPEKQSRRRPRLGRSLSALTLGLALVGLVGDRAHTAGLGGIDPLEVLNLSVKPNVIVVLDSSGSMREDISSDGSLSGDWPGSKMFQAKSVLQQVIAANETKVNFLFGQYTQQDSVFNNENPGETRFYYTTTDTSMATNELSVQRTSGADVTADGHAAWQDIRAAWNTLYFAEQITTVTTVITPVVINAGNNRFIWRERIAIGPPSFTYITCTVTLPVGLYGTYDDDAELSNLATQLNNFMTPGVVVAGRSCVKTGTAAGAPFPLAANEPVHRLTFTWLAGTDQMQITKAAASAPAGTRRIQIVRSTVAGNTTIFHQLGFATSIPNPPGNTITPGSPVGAADGNWSAVNLFTGGPISTNSTTVGLIQCTVTVPPGFYRLGGPATTAGTLAQVLRDGMNACPGRGATPNTYTVVYDDNLNAPAIGNDDNGDFTFSRTAGANPFIMRWGAGPNNIAGALGSPQTPDTGLSTGSKSSGASIRLLFRDTGDDFLTTFNNTRTYFLRAARFFNGEVYNVLADGTVCGVQGTVTPVTPPTVTLQRVSSCGGATAGAPVVFTYAGARFAGNSVSCDGFVTKVNLAACNAAPGTQVAAINPLLQREIPFTANGLALQGYTESTDGSWDTATFPPTGPGIVADGSTPIAPSLDDIRTLFNTLWTSGQNPGPPVLSAISGHSNPKERTIVMFVTDGDDTCAIHTGTVSSAEADENALAASYSASLLYDPIVGGVQTSGFLTSGADSASSVVTYVVGFGSGAATNRLNWIAWGGSGLGGQSATLGVTSSIRWTNQPTAGQRASCATCQDAFIAPDQATLSAALQAILDQGATAGSFTAQQSIVANVFELVGEVTGFSPNAPKTRYDAIVPLQFQASFDLPGFQGKLKAIQFDTASSTAFTKWEAGQKLLDRVTNGTAGGNGIGMNSLTGAALRAGAAVGQGTFSQLHGNGAFTEATIRTASTAYVKRRIFTTSRNGSFTLGGGTPILDSSLTNLRNGVSPTRVTLWPPSTAAVATSVAPASDSVQGAFDVALGLPSDAQITANAAAELATLQTTFKACRGVGLPANCAGTTATIARRARREAREMILAYMAGAEVVPNAAGDPARITAAATGDIIGDILYKARNWVLAESTLAPPAIVASPVSSSVAPSSFKQEYVNYVDGTPIPGVKTNLVSQGFGLANPDQDNNTPPGPPNPAIDGRTTQKPVMTVAYLGANDMLHAFRAGPNCAGTGSGLAAVYPAACEKGGEELWGFVPYDRLVALKELMKPQTRQNKTYVIGAALRFADVFIDAPGGFVNDASLVGGCSGRPCGLWRQLLMFGRGPGGKFVTTLDITNRGSYTGNALDSQAPIVLWSRGNPDTNDGTVGGTNNNNAADRTAYDKMGETWSTPAVVFVNRAQNVTARRPYNAAAGTGGVPMVAYMGSGYCGPCNPGEGTTFFTLDVTTGDVVAAVNVETEALAAGVNRTGLPYANALVASPAAWTPSTFDPLQPGHPADLSTRVYIGDLHGRLWKFLSAAPTQALLMADLGANQPVGTAAALLGLAADGSGSGTGPKSPFVFVTSGNDKRAVTGPFKIFGFKDGGDDTTATYGSATPTTDPGVSVYSPTEFQFSRAFDLPQFRGTIAPATALTGGSLGTKGRVFFGGTRFNEPGSPEAPPPFPCRSSFDSIIFALGAVTGGAAYDLNSSGDDAYMMFSNSRKTAIQVIKQPTPPGAPAGTTGKGTLQIDEGLMGSGSVQPPPAPGLQPQIPAAPNVGLVRTDAQGVTFPQFTSPKLCQGQ